MWHRRGTLVAPLGRPSCRLSVVFAALVVPALRVCCEAGASDSPAPAATAAALARNGNNGTSLLQSTLGIAKYEVPLRSRSWQKYRQAMVNFGDVQYISYVTIGGQIISGILDTGSFELVVFSKACQSCGRAGKYDNSLSTTYRAGKLASGQSYGSGDTYSIEAFDEVLIGNKKRNQTFWEVMEAHMPILAHAAFQSIIGMGPPETPAADAWSAAKSAAKNVTMLLAKGRPASVELRKKVSDKVTIAQEMSRRTTMLHTFAVRMFSVCVGATPGADGYFIWNDTTALEKPHLFTRVPVVGKHTWSVQLANVMLEQKPNMVHQLMAAKLPTKQSLGCKEGCSALIDSGTSLLAVPTFVINELLLAMENMGANCSKMDLLPDLVFELNGTRFSLPADAYVAEVQGNVPNYLASFVRVRNLHRKDGQCQLILMESFADSMFGPLWILGVPFFRKYYTTFNVGAKKSDRSLYIAPASEDCNPVKAGSSAATAKPYVRQIDPSKLYVPQTVQRAASETYVNM